MALALYRKYRPRTFAEIIGQEHVTEPLSQALRTGRLHHAYLFSGPRGCGKTSSARILARSLNCAKGPTPDPCGECESCRALAPDGPGSIDVIEIDAASHGGVDDARDLRERAFFAPAASRFKVYVIDEAHMVSTAGFNALLKLVEEPPDYVKFVFATTEPEKVLPTIKSRTHHYPFRLIPPGSLRPYLEQLCVAEGVPVQSTVFPLVVRAGAGSVRDSLSVLDQLIAGAGPEGVTYARAVALLGVTDVALIDEMCDALAAGDGAAAYETIDRVAEAGHDPRRFAGDLLERLRDLIVLRQVPDAAAKGLLGGADDELDRMTTQADRFGPATLSRMADIVHTGLVDMRGTTAPRLVLELVTARMLLPGAEDSVASLLQRMERMERRLTLSGEPATPVGSGTDQADSPVRRPAAPAAGRSIAVASPGEGATSPADVASSPASAAAPVTTTGTGPGVARETGSARLAASDPMRSAAQPAAESPTPDASDRSAETPAAVSPPAPAATLDAAAVRRIWDEVLTMVRRKSPRAAAVVRDATVRDVDGNTIVLLFKYPFHAQTLASSPELLLEALYEVLGGQWQVRCEVAGQAGVVTAGSANANGPTRQATPAKADSAPATDASPPPAGRRSGRSESGGSRQRGSDDAASEGAPAGADSADDEEWPTPAALGGPAPSNEVAPVQRVPASTTPATPTGIPAVTMQATASSAHATASSARAAASSARAAARAAAAGNGPGARRASDAAPAAGRGASGGRRGPVSGRGATGRPPATTARPGARDNSSADDAWAGGENDDAPYDPEFDGPIASTSRVGFDPGDEPDDDADAGAVRQTSEQQALELLREALGAELIEEIDNR